jgi:hypothetical protein
MFYDLEGCLFASVEPLSYSHRAARRRQGVLMLFDSRYREVNRLNDMIPNMVVLQGQYFLSQALSCINQLWCCFLAL